MEEGQLERETLRPENVYIKGTGGRGLAPEPVLKPGLSASCVVSLSPLGVSQEKSYFLSRMVGYAIFPVPFPVQSLEHPATCCLG